MKRPLDGLDSIFLIRNQHGHPVKLVLYKELLFSETSGNVGIQEMSRARENVQKGDMLSQHKHQSLNDNAEGRDDQHDPMLHQGGSFVNPLPLWCPY